MCLKHKIYNSTQLTLHLALQTFFGSFFESKKNGRKIARLTQSHGFQMSLDPASAIDPVPQAAPPWDFGVLKVVLGEGARVSIAGNTKEVILYNIYPDAQCMAYLPTFTIKTTQM